MQVQRETTGVSSRPLGLGSWLPLRITRQVRLCSLRPCATLTPGAGARAAAEVLSHDIANVDPSSMPPTALHLVAGRFKNFNSHF